MHVVGLRILWRNAGWLRLEAAVVFLHKVGGGVVGFVVVEIKIA